MRVSWKILGMGLIAISLGASVRAQEPTLKPGDFIAIFPQPWSDTENQLSQETICEAVREIPSRRPPSPDSEDGPSWEYRCYVQGPSSVGSSCSIETKILASYDLRWSPLLRGLSEIPMARVGMDVVVRGRVVRAKEFARARLITDEHGNGNNFYFVQDQNNCWYGAGDQAPPVQLSQFPANGFQRGEQVYVAERNFYEEGIDPLHLPITPTTVAGWAPIREYETCFDDTGAYCRSEAYYGSGAPGLPYPIWTNAKVIAYSYIFANGRVMEVPVDEEGNMNNYEAAIWRSATEREMRDNELPAPQSRLVHLESGRVLTIQNYIARGPRCAETDCYSGDILFSDASQGTWAQWSRDDYSLLENISFALNVRRNDRISGDRVVMNGTGEVTPTDEIITAISDTAAQYFLGKIEDRPNRYTLALTESGKRFILATCEQGNGYYDSPSGPVLGPLCTAERDGSTRSIYAIQVP